MLAGVLAASCARAPAPELPVVSTEASGVRVRVVEGDGAPAAGVPVGLFHAGSRIGPSVRTDARGLALLSDADLERLPPDRRGGLELGLDFAQRSPVRAPVELEALPAAPLLFVKPPTGRIALRLLDPEGAPYSGTTFVFVRPPYREGALTSRKTMTRVKVEDGSATIPHVEVGLPLELHWGARRAEDVSAVVDPPQESGETVEVTLQSKRWLPTVVGRALGADGAPLADVELSLGEQRAGGRVDVLPYYVPVRTDEEGRFVHPTRAGELAPRVGFHLVATRDDGGVIDARLAPRAPGAGASFELGDVRLDRPPVVARGRVVDERGAPVGGARVGLFVQLTQGRSTNRVGLRGASVQSAADGSFALRARVPDSTLRVNAAMAGFLVSQLAAPSALEADEGTTLVLERHCSIQGSIALKGAPDPARLSVAARWPNPDEPRRSYQTRGVQPDSSGRFVVPDLRPRTYSLVVLLGEHQLLVEIPDLALDGGRTCAPDGIQGIDLSAVWRRVTVTVADATGELLSEGELHLAREGRWSHRETFELDGRPRTVELTGGEPWVVEAIAPGYRALRVEDVDGDVELVLAPEIPARLILPDELELPPAPWRLGVQLRRHVKPPARPRSMRARAWRPAYREWAEFGDEHALTLTVDEPGRWEVRFRLLGEGSTDGGDLGAWEPAIYVLESSEAQAFAVEPGRQEYRLASGAWRD